MLVVRRGGGEGAFAQRQESACQTVGVTAAAVVVEFGGGVLLRVGGGDEVYDATSRRWRFSAESLSTILPLFLYRSV